MLCVKVGESHFGLHVYDVVDDYGYIGKILFLHKDNKDEEQPNKHRTKTETLTRQLNQKKMFIRKHSKS